MNNIISEIKVSNNIVLLCHNNPDGDAVGSVLALINGLKSLNKDCYVISKDKLSDNLKFLKDSEEISSEIVEPTIYSE